MENEKRTNLNKRKKVSVILATALAIILSFVGGFFSHYIFLPKEASTASEIVNLIQKCAYVLDENGNLKEFTANDYAQAIADGLLDKYSRYYSPEEYEKNEREEAGNQKGYGFYLYGDEHLPKIKEIIGNSPADRAGLLGGDYINSCAVAGQEKVVFSKTKDLTDFLTQRTDSETLTFEIIRGGETLFFTIKRENYVTSYVNYYDSECKMSLCLQGGQFVPMQVVEGKIAELDSDTALIRLDLFEGEVAMQFRLALNYMLNRGRTKLILDLRDNGGGLMDTLCDVASDLIYNNNQKTIIAYSQGKSESETFYMNTARPHEFITDIAVLANNYTASASETLIGALLHYGEKFSINRLVIEKDEYGVAKTFGKGIMQRTYLLISGGAFKLTTAKVLWPDRTTCIHEKGILPKTENATEKGISAVIRAQETLRLPA